MKEGVEGVQAPPSAPQKMNKATFEKETLKIKYINMKQKLRFILLLLLTFISSSTMWAGESEVYNFVFAQQSGPSGYDKTYNVTIGEKSWTIPGNMTNGNYLRIGGKNLDKENRVIQCNEVLSGTINRIAFNHNGKSRANITVHSVTLTVASDEGFENVVEKVVVTEPTIEKSTEGSFDFVPSSKAWTGNLYYKFTVNISNSDSSNGGLDLTSLVFYQNVAGAVDPTVSFADESKEVEIGGTVTNELSKPNDLTVSYSSSSPSIATVDENGLVTGVAEGEATITASWNAVADKYNAGSVSYVVTVIPAAPSVNFVKVTNANQLVAGNEYILVGSRGGSTAAMGVRTGTNTYRDKVEVTIEDDKVSVKENSGIAILTLGGKSGEWTFSASDNDEYLAYTSTTGSNVLHSATDPTLKTSQWIITSDFQIANANYTDRYIQYNSGSSRFACYTSTQGASYLYVKEGSPINDKLDPSLAFSSSEVSANLGEDFTAPTLSYAEGFDGTVTYTSSNESVATVATDGTVTILAAGTTTITASSEQTSNFIAGEAKYTLTVVDPNAPGTKNNPYTVAQARAAIDAETGTTDVYVTGTVSEIVTAFNEQYGNISYNISADGETTSDQLQAFRGKSFNGENFTSEDDVQVGDVVVIYGSLTKFNSTYEFAADNYLISLVRPGNNDPVINANTSLELAYDATSGEIAYSITNPVSGKSLQANSTADWISNIAVSDNKVTFTTTTNSGSEDRTATITLSYEGAKPVNVTVTQKPVDYAELPFAFDGGKADVNSTAGLTQNGLDTDYNASPKLKFDSTGDELILKINERPGKLSFDIKGNSFSGGIFTLQASTDGTSYADVESYTSLSSTQTIKINSLGENVRYIKWIYTKKSSGNVALGNIKLAVYSNLTDPELSFEKPEYTAVYGEEFTAPTLTNQYSVTVTYSSSNEDVATVDATTGAVTLVGAGETTITATSEANETYEAGSASYKLTVTESETPTDNDDVFELVTTNDLAEGDEIIIVNVKETTTPANEEEGIEESTTITYKGLSTEQNNNNRGAIGVNANNDGTLKGNNKLQVITLEVATKTNTETNEVTKTDNWWLNVGNGYLYAASNSSNHLKTEQKPDSNGNADAAITFTEDEDKGDIPSIVFQGKNKRNILKYNEDNDIFSCYESGQKDVKIYRKKAVVAGVPGDANDDGIVSVADVMLTVNKVLNRPGLVINEKNADVNGDESITVTDVMLIVKLVLKKE